MDNFQEFGEWTVGRGIKNGRTCIVTRKGNNSEYVLKKPGPNSSGSIANEVAVLKRLEGHPNILSLVDYDLQHSTPYQVTPFYEGRGTLKGSTYKSWTIDELNPKSIADLLRQVAQAIGYMHSQGVIHGELVSPHIVMTKDRTPGYYRF